MPPRLDEVPDVLTVKEAASLLRVGRNQLYESIHRAETPHFRIGRSLRVPKAGLLLMVFSPSHKTDAAGVAAPTASKEGRDDAATRRS